MLKSSENETSKADKSTAELSSVIGRVEKFEKTFEEKQADAQLLHDETLKKYDDLKSSLSEVQHLVENISSASEGGEESSAMLSNRLDEFCARMEKFEKSVAQNGSDVVVLKSTFDGYVEEQVVLLLLYKL